MKRWYQFICFKQSPQRLLLFLGYIVVFILVIIFNIVVIRAYVPCWFHKTKILSSLKDISLELPANFADFPSDGPCTWAILSRGDWDVLWGKHTGLRDVAEWQIAFHVNQGTTNVSPTTSDKAYDLIKRKLNTNGIDLGFYNPQLKTIKGIAIARFISSERK
ncbi:MAG: hypothetical protein LBK82_09790, partial [Planctomycetaceae bacterium]|nr:hypothetical protein [Planctomycetaceae bacterium]